MQCMAYPSTKLHRAEDNITDAACFLTCGMCRAPEQTNGGKALTTVYSVVSAFIAKERVLQGFHCDASLI